MRATWRNSSGVEVREVEAQVVGRDERALLLHVRAEHLAQGLVQQVGGRVVGFAAAACLFVHAGAEHGAGPCGQLLRQVYGQVVLALRVEDFHGLAVALEHAAVAHLSAHFGIKRRRVEHELVEGLLLLLHAAVAQDAGVALGAVPAAELRLALSQYDPVVRLDGGSVAGALLLLLHLGVEGGLVHLESLLVADELRQVERESVGVKQGEGLHAVHSVAALLLGLGYDALEHGDARGKRAQEGFLLLLHDALDEVLLCLQLGVGVAHLLHECRHEAVHESAPLAQEGVGVAHGAAQDAADDVARLGVGGQLPVGNAEGDGAQVVGYDAHGHVDLLVRSVGEAAQLADFADDGLEHVGVVVGVLALHDADQALKAHPGVDDAVGQRFERAVGLAVVLHEYQVPYFYDLRVVLVDELRAGHGRFLLFGARVNVDFGAGAAGAGVAHFPEVVVAVAVDDVVLGEELRPVAGGLVVAREALFGRALEHGDVEVLGINLEHFHQILVSPRDGLFLEIVAKTPVAQHLEHGVVVRVVSHLFQVVVLAGDAQALLRIGLPPALRLGVAQDNVLELVHAGIREHERRVVLDYHRRGGHDEMSVLLEEALEGFPYFVGCHHKNECFLSNLARSYENPESWTKAPPA